MRLAYPVGFLLAAGACRATPPTPTSPSDSATPDGVTCDVDSDNALRGRCDVVLSQPTQVLVEYWPAGLAGRHRTMATAAPVGVLPLLPPETSIMWVAKADDRVWDGTFETGPVPERVAIAAEVKGSPSDPLVGFVSPCVAGAVAIIADARTGDVIWYQSMIDGELGGVLDAVTFTTRRTVLGVVNRGLREVDLQGQVVLDVPAERLRRPLHHDVVRQGAHVYALTQEVVTDPEGRMHLLDGFVVIDDAGTVVAEWFLGDHHQPATHDAGEGEVDDYSHANSLWVDDDGHVVISFRHLSTVIKVRGVDDPAFGEVLWAWAGQDDAPLGDDISTVNATGGPDGFGAQHHVFRREDGRWAMFDNRLVGPESSRVLVAELDEGTGSATLLQAYDVGSQCPFQGAAWHTTLGHPVATCAPFRTALEYAADAHSGDEAPEDPLWVFTSRCLGASVPYVARYTPLDW